MKWRISWLKNQPEQRYHVDETLTFERNMFKNVSNIDYVSEIKVVGDLFMEDDLVNIDLIVSGIYYLPCALSNEICDYPFSFEVQDALDEDSTLNTIDYHADYIDLYEIIWQRLIVEAPTKFVKNKNINKSGKSWKLLSEEEYQKQFHEQIDPRFEKLKDLFKDDKEDQ